MTLINRNSVKSEKIRKTVTVVVFPVNWHRRREKRNQIEEEKNLAIMVMKKKDKRLYDRIMHSKKKKRSEVNYFSVNFFVY